MLLSFHRNHATLLSHIALLHSLAGSCTHASCCLCTGCLHVLLRFPAPHACLYLRTTHAILAKDPDVTTGRKGIARHPVSSIERQQVAHGASEQVSAVGASKGREKAHNTHADRDSEVAVGDVFDLQSRISILFPSLLYLIKHGSNL